MHVRMLKDFPLAVDGFTTRERKKDEELEVNDEMGKSLIRDKVCVEIDAPEPEAEEVETSKGKKGKK